MVFVEVRLDLGFQAWLFLLHQKRQELLAKQNEEMSLEGKMVEGCVDPSS